MFSRKIINSNELGSTYDITVSRFFNLEHELSKDLEMYEQYQNCVQKYEKLDHLKIVDRSGKYHIPHHAVVKGDTKKVKLRVISDASSKSTSGKSLNDLLHVGLKLQIDIYLIYYFVVG